MIRRVQLLTIDSWGNTEEVITPFRPPDVKKGRNEAANLQEERSMVVELGTRSKRC
jgi:hypothetical protein